MIRRALVIHGWSAVVGDVEVRAGFQPQVVRQTGVEAGRREILFRVRGHRQDRVVEVRRQRRVAADRTPVLVLHRNDEHGLDRL